jgi:hypothetical protein
VAEHTEQVRYGRLDKDFVASLRAVTVEQDDAFLMLNLMRYRPWADYGDDRPRITGREADDLYAPVDILAELGAEIVLFGDVVEQPRGDEAWDRVAIVRYPTVRSFLDMQERPDFIARHVHKDAGMERTVIAVCRPMAGALGAGDKMLVDLVTDTEVEAAPGQLLLRVEGSPVNDGPQWSTLVLTALDDEKGAGDHLAGYGGEATSVIVAAMLNTLR